MQIKNQIRDKILSSELLEGFILPPERKLAETLGVNRSTVINAYQELKADGLIDSHVGKGTIVIHQMFDESGSGESFVNPIPWYQLFNDNITSNNERIISEIMGTTLSGDVVSFAGGIPSPELYPVQTMRDIITDLMETSAVDMFYNSPVRGHYPLRESISQMLVERHMQVSPKELIILSGSQ